MRMALLPCRLCYRRIFILARIFSRAASFRSSSLMNCSSAFIRSRNAFFFGIRDFETEISEK